MKRAAAERWYGESWDAMEVYEGVDERRVYLFFREAPRDSECCPRNQHSTGWWMLEVCPRHQLEFEL